MLYLSLICSIALLLSAGVEASKHNGTQHATRQSILYLIPKNPDKIHNVNEKSEFDLKTIKRKGWLIEANVKTTFNILVKFSINETFMLDLNSSFIDRVIYIYFTTNNSYCTDFTSYTHIPIIIQQNISSSPQISSKYLIHKSEIEVSLTHQANKAYYICLQNFYGENYYDFEHQGTAYWLSVITYENNIPFWLRIVVYVLMVMVSAFFNGLNLGLMSLDVDELKLLMKTSDSPNERKYAENILPLRKNGNFLLCSILLSLTLAMSISTLILGNLMDGLLAGILSTFILCIFSEIIPQAICSKYSLPIGSYSRNITMVFLIITSPVSYPFSKIIDFTLGKEVPTEYNRDKIKELMKKSKGLQDNELQIISGALDFKNKTVGDIMVPLKDVFMLNNKNVLDFNTMLHIYNSGFSRIPIFQEMRGRIIGWLHIKDLSLIDPQDELPLDTLLNLFKHKVTYFHNSDKLNEIFDIFRKGETHLAFIYDSTLNDDGYKNCIGIVTLHDVIEALVQFKINDEFDYNEKPKYGVNYLKHIVAKYTDSRKNDAGFLHPQLKLVLIQRLCTIKPFKEEFITKSILEQIITNKDSLINIRIPQQCIDSTDCHYVYKYGKSCNYFIFLIEGHLTLEIGSEKIEYVVRPFEYFGVHALLGDCNSLNQVLDNNPVYKPYVPEYTLKVDYKNYWKSDTKNGYSSVVYLKIDRNAWLNAVKTTQLKKSTLIIP